MGSSVKVCVILVMLLVVVVLPPAAPGEEEEKDLSPECLRVPTSVFANSVKSTIETIAKVTSVVSQFSNALGDFRLSNAISDCLDLLDFSADELTWTLSAAEAYRGSKNKSSSSGNGDRMMGSNLQTWLSAALGNQDTCVDGFEGTNSFVKPIVAASLSQVTSLVRDILTMVEHPTANQFLLEMEEKKKKNKKEASPEQYPSWLKVRDRKLLQQGNGVLANVTVAADGTGNFTRVLDAVMAAPDYSTHRYIIYVKRGVYLENVEIKKKKWNLALIGDGLNLTVISGNRSFIDGWTTFRSATFAVSGRGFVARDLSFENTAGPQKHQAVALRSDSDLSVFYRCGIRGYQDTLYAHSLRQFYRECEITGTVDFIFGNGAVVLQKCQILARKGLPDQKNTITAQGRKDPYQTSGFAIQFSNISAEADLLHNSSTTNTTYLGRPWKLYSRTMFMQSYMSSTISPQGWLEWNADFALGTLFYGEYMNYGPGASLDSRVNWPGFHAINDSSQAANFTVAQFIEGNMWLPSTGVSYTAGLIS